MEKNKIIRRLFRNNKFLAIFSLFLSLVIWMWTASNTDLGITKNISDIPIHIQLSDEAQNDGLKIFSIRDENGAAVSKASISVTGDRITLGSLSKSDIQISAPEAGTVISPGTYTYSLEAKKSGLMSGYQFMSTVYPQKVTVFVDRYVDSKQFKIENNLTYKVAPNYYAIPVLSSDTVNISGAESEVNRIAKVVVEGSISGKLTQTATLDKDIILYDKYNKKINSDMITMSIDSVTDTIAVYPQKQLPFQIGFDNSPSGFSIPGSSVTINPKSILIAGPDSTLITMQNIQLSNIDFSQLKNGINNFNVPVTLPDKFTNISNQLTANVKVDLSSMSSKSFTVAKFAYSGLPSNYSAASQSNSVKVTIIGPKSQLSNLHSSDITAVFDLSTQTASGFVGTTSLPVKIQVGGSGTSCWAYGSYSANVQITETSTQPQQ